MPPSSRPTRASLDEAIAYAATCYTLEPEDGFAFRDGHSEEFRGWRVRVVDTRGGRPRRASFLLYNDAVTRAAVEAAIGAWFRQEGR